MCACGTRVHAFQKYKLNSNFDVNVRPYANKHLICDAQQNT